VPALLLVTDERGAFGAAGSNLRYAIALLTGAEWGRTGHETTGLARFRPVADGQVRPLSDRYLLYLALAKLL